jgi:hypothetical protein
VFIYTAVIYGYAFDFAGVEEKWIWVVGLVTSAIMLFQGRRK